MENKKIPCSVQVLTLNSGETLLTCLKSVRDFAEIVILDGNSTDNTVEIAKGYRTKIYPQFDSNESNIRITDFAAVRNRGLKIATYDWCLILDSDEYLSPQAADEIREIVARGRENEYFIYNLPRKYVLEGKEVASLKPTYQLRFFYRPATLGFSKRVHERIKPKEGFGVGTLMYPEFVPLEDIKTLRIKWAHYLDIEQDKMRDITFGMFLIKVRANVVKFLKYMLKAAYNTMRHPRAGVPFKYEFYNAVYHLQIIHRLFINLIHNTLKRK
ncbi:hypothetical protein BK004_01255 [bacterium CG10_46_32]|nr:MAG: hypothetical protein BK004_01255 [bacterium CG10_46_32]PIR56326.1 MAG: hypothetical protein COU73_01270 [Parcubacteria group bacterium CG10_big_fil_rev_8_21_14_0_10_46_32]